ncbi:MAG: DHA2 family efflux MFS transporter permease subunit [Chloroflexota bacterium]
MRFLPTCSIRGSQPNPWLILVVLCAGVFMMLLDTTIVNLAQQDIRRDLGANLSQMQWVLDSYILVFAVLLLTTGRLGDLYGRLRLFTIGVGIFTVASVLCAGSGMIGDFGGISGANALIAARVLQGLGAAILMPQTIALVTVTFPPERRGAAFGVWSSVAASAGVVGMLVGGAIITYLSWEWIFLINLPLGIAVMTAAVWLIPECHDPLARARFDFRGMMLSALGLFALVFALIEASRFGWSSPIILGALLAGVSLLTLFVVWERRAPEPMMKLELFSIRNFWAGNIIMAVVNFSFFGLLLPLTVLLQGVLGFSAICAGVTLMPLALMISLIAPFAGRLSDKIGPRGLLLGGFTLVGAGMLLLIGQVGADATTLELLPPLFIMGTGFALAVSQMNVVPMRQVPELMAGSASGVLNTTRSISQLFGIAALSSAMQLLAASEAKSTLEATRIGSELRHQASDLVSEGRFGELSSLGGQAEQVILQALYRDLQDSFITGFSGAVVLAGAAIILGLGSAILVRTGEPAPLADRTPPATEPASSGD